MLRIVLCTDDVAFARLEPLRTALRNKIGARASTALPKLSEAKTAEILERSAVQSGTAFESGLAAAVAADLCRDGPCRAIDIQIVARAIADLRLGSVRRYRRSGGASVLPSVWLDRVAADCGGAIARRALIAAATQGAVEPDDLGARTRNGRDPGADALAGLRARGLMVTTPRGPARGLRAGAPGAARGGAAGDAGRPRAHGAGAPDAGPAARRGRTAAARRAGHRRPVAARHAGCR